MGYMGLKIPRPKATICVLIQKYNQFYDIITTNLLIRIHLAICVLIQKYNQFYDIIIWP